MFGHFVGLALKELKWSISAIKLFYTKSTAFSYDFLADTMNITLLREFKDHFHDHQHVPT